jgi:hypothetical protein
MSLSSSDLGRIIWHIEGVDWIHLAQDMVQLQTVVHTVMNLRVPLKAAEPISYSENDCPP